MKTTDTRTIRSQWQLISALGNIKGGTLVTLTTLTSVQMDDFRCGLELTSHSNPIHFLMGGGSFPIG